MVTAGVNARPTPAPRSHLQPNCLGPLNLLKRSHLYNALEPGQLATTTVSLREEDDLARFSVRVSPGCACERVETALTSSGAGRLDGDEASINVDWLRQHTASHSEQWQSDFDKMLDYASSKGCTDPALTVVRVHITHLES